MLIVLLGFPKAGTSSFHRLFQQLSFHSLHGQAAKKDCLGARMRRARRRKRPLLSTISHHRGTLAICEMTGPWFSHRLFFPQLYFKELVKERPDALFILNYRKSPDLLCSWERWWRGGLNKDMERHRPDLLRKYKGSRDQRIIQFFDSHYQNVRAFFHSRPELAFVDFNIQTDSLTKLSKWIDCKGITHLPHVNKNARMRRGETRQARKR